MDRRAREAAARRFWPERLNVLVIAEAPPKALDRYFYFEDVPEQDSLFRYICKGVLGETPTRSEKPAYLRRLQNAGVGLIDLSVDPLPFPGAPLAQHVVDLVVRARTLSPAHIVLVKATVFDAAYAPLVRAGLPVIDVRIPFPGSGRQREFETAFAKALAQTQIGGPDDRSP